MSAEIRPADYESRISDLERRLKIAEATSRLISSSVRDGAITFQDQNGNTIVIVGKLTDGSHGIIMETTTGALSYMFNERGLLYPAPTIYLAATHTQELITSGTYVNCFTGLQDTFSASAIHGSIPIVCDVGTTGELQVYTNGGTSTGTFSIPSGFSGFAIVNWLHGQSIGAGPAHVFIRARRATGAGQFAVFASSDFQMIDGDRFGAVASPGIS